MQVGFTTNLFRYARVSATPAASANFAAVAPASRDDITQLNLNDQRVSRLTAVLNEFDELLTRTQVRRSAGLASAISFSSLGLSDISTPSRLESVEEVNSATTSYTPFGPTFTGSGSSSALPTLSGVYDGSNGDDTLRFRVTRTGTHGQSRIDIKVYDSGGDQLDTIKINQNHPIDREYTLSNGLIFTLGEGTLVKNDDFYLNVYANTPSDVDPDKAFDGTRNDRPDFDYGFAVDAGTFDINDVTITVNADDTINAVLDRINNSAADVEAVYDSGTDSVTITHNQAGPEHTITTGNDTSGFLAATKLTGAVITGLGQESQLALSQTLRFSEVTSGNISINNSTVDFDVTSDSLTDIIERINAANLNVTASLIHDGQRVLLKSTLEGAALTLDDNGTGLFDALDVTEKTYNAKARNGFSTQRSYEIANRIEDAGEIVNDIYDNGSNPVPDSAALASLRNNILSALRSTAPDGDAGFGVRFAVDGTTGGNFLSIDRRTLTRAQQQNIGPARDYFHALATTLRGALFNYQIGFGQSSSGTLLNATA